jgi:hypothetical protein
MNQQEDPFGKFSGDDKRLEAIKIREHRLFVHGILRLTTVLIVYVALISAVLKEVPSELMTVLMSSIAYFLHE